MIEAACDAYQIKPSDFRSRFRYTQFVRPRQAVCYVLRRKRKDLSFSQIARLVGRKDHSTIVHAIHQAEFLRGVDPKFSDLCDRLELLA